MADKKPDDVSATSTAYDAMRPRWELISSLLGGTETMRAAGEAYLPRHEQETTEAYGKRLASTVLYNVTGKTLEWITSKVFSEPMKPGEDVPPEIAALLDDVDLQGNPLDEFCAHWFNDGVAKAFSCVLVDHPRVEPNPDGSPRTLDQDRRENVRPYWTHVAPENLISLRTQTINGREVAVHARILECSLEPVGFAEALVKRIRELNLVGLPGGGTAVQVTLWREGQDRKWAVEDGWTMGVPEIPLVVFYSSRDGVAFGKPPLTDLAHLNVAHWQSDSDQRNCLRVARFPMLAASGVDEDADLAVGPNQILSTTAPEGKFYYVEHQGHALQAGREDLKALEDQMAAYGAEFLRKAPGNESATAAKQDSVEACSPLERWARAFKASVDQALYYTAVWLRLGSGGTVDMTVDFDEEDLGQPALDALDKMRARRDISRVNYIEELKRRRILREDFDAEEDRGLLDEEPPSPEMAALAGPGPGAGE